jgi:hypothetical protein
MKQASEDLEARRPVWWALSDLFLDTELDELAYNYIARTCVDSPYSLKECEEILWDEVYPICIGNLFSMTGVWGAFDQEWLEYEITRHVSTWRFRFWQRLGRKQPLFGRIVLSDWHEVQKRIEAMENIKSE